MERSILKMRLPAFIIIGAVLSATICQVCSEKAYFFNTVSKMDWFRANVFCETNNMRLVSIHSLTEHNLILRKAHELGLKNVPLWTAGNDLAQEGVFYWGFRQKKTYTNWHVGEPNNVKGIEHCTAIWPKHGANLWNDCFCTTECFTICEYYINSRQLVASNLTLDEISKEVPL